MPVIKLHPALKAYLWGGTRLADRFGKAEPGRVIAESWELSAHPAGLSTVAGTGQPFPDYLKTLTPRQLGRDYDREQPFPFLIKFIDAALPLSVQVHPNDDQARRLENSAGKTEIWHIVEAADDATIYLGLKPGVTRADFSRALRDGTVCDLLIRYTVSPGETYYIPAGTVHAIGAGCLICEVQQSSDITYRVFDYNRTDSDGNPRRLHLERALEVIPFLADAPAGLRQKPHAADGVLCRCNYFCSILLDTAKTASMPVDPRSFVSLIILRGSGAVYCQNDRFSAKAGDSFFATADCGHLSFTGSFEAIITVLPQIFVG